MQNLRLMFFCINPNQFRLQYNHQTQISNKQTFMTSIQSQNFQNNSKFQGRYQDSNDFLDQIDRDVQTQQFKNCNQNSVGIETNYTMDEENSHQSSMDQIVNQSQFNHCLSNFQNDNLIVDKSLFDQQVEDQDQIQMEVNIIEVDSNQKVINWENKKEKKYSETKNAQADIMNHIKKRLAVRLGTKFDKLKKIQKQLNKIMTKKSYNLQDFQNLFQIKEIQSEMKNIFEEGDLKRQIMIAKYQEEKRKQTYMRIIRVLQKAFNNKSLKRLKY